MVQHYSPRARLRFENLEDRLLLSARVIEVFTSGLDAYQGIYRYYPAADVVPGAAHDGVGNALVKHDGSEWMVRDDAAVQVHAGETISVWTKFAGAVDGRIYFGFGSTPNGTYHSPLYTGGTLALVLAGNTNQMMFMSNDPYDANHPTLYGFKRPPTVIGQPAVQSYVADQWYQLQVVWGKDGSLAGNLYDSDGNLLNTVKASDTVITSGGIAFRGFGSDKYFDTVAVDRPIVAHAPKQGGVPDIVQPPGPPADPGTGPLITNWDGGTGTVLPFAYTSVSGTGRDIALNTFDQLQQVHDPIGGMVGLAAANTSYNVGDVQVSWGPDPFDSMVYRDVPNESPLLAQYLFRERPGEPTTLIGSSDVKRFYSAGPEAADYEFLNPGEGDVYFSSTNSTQVRYLPGADLDPVIGDIPRPSYDSYVNQDGFDTYQAPTFANTIEHLLKVNQSDLDPAQNPPGTRWFLAGNLFVTADDDVSDNSRWLEIVPAWNPLTQRFSFMYPNGSGGQFDFRTIPNLSTAPYLVRANPAGEVLSQPVDTMSVTFDRAIDPASFTPGQVQFTGPNGPITVSAVTPIDDADTRFTITFSSQAANGSYALVLGTGIADQGGVHLDVTRTIAFDIQGATGAPGLPAHGRGALTHMAEAAVMTAAPPSVHSATPTLPGAHDRHREPWRFVSPEAAFTTPRVPNSEPAHALSLQSADSALTDILAVVADSLFG